MKHRHIQTGISSGGSAIKSILLGMVLLAAHAGAASAALIDGTMGLGGSYSIPGGLSIADATAVTLDSVNAGKSSGTLGTTLPLFTPGVTSGDVISLDAFAPVADIITIGGWTLDISTMNVVDQTLSVITLQGTGLLTGNGFDPTNAIWTLSAQGASAYSMTVEAVIPIPAAIWLFGTGLIGLVAVGRRKLA